MKKYTQIHTVSTYSQSLEGGLESEGRVSSDSCEWGPWEGLMCSRCRVVFNPMAAQHNATFPLCSIECSKVPYKRSGDDRVEV